VGTKYYVRYQNHIFTSYHSKGRFPPQVLVLVPVLSYSAPDFYCLRKVGKRRLNLVHLRPGAPMLDTSFLADLINACCCIIGSSLVNTATGFACLRR